MTTINLKNLENKIKQINDLYISQVVARDMYKRTLEQKEKELKEIEEKISALTQSIDILQDFHLNLEIGIIKKFEELVTKGIQEIFGKQYKFIIEFKNENIGTSADFYIKIPESDKIINLASGEGGGIKDFISVLIRMLYLILEPSKPAKILFLDENLKHLDRERAIKALKFIKELAEKLNIQVVFITHLDVNDYDVDGINIIKIQ
jgi:DNA repair exonuclease SbcCD ATPase subunit